MLRGDLTLRSRLDRFAPGQKPAAWRSAGFVPVDTFYRPRPLPGLDLRAAPGTQPTASGTCPDVLNRAKGAVRRRGSPARLHGVAPGQERPRRAAGADSGESGGDPGSAARLPLTAASVQPTVRASC